MVAIDEKMVRSLISAKKIQKLFFLSGSGELSFQVTAKPISLSSNLGAMDMVYEEQELLYEHGPVQSVRFAWPTKYPDSLAKFTFYDIQSNRVVKVRGEGSWALLRLFAKLNRKVVSPTKMVISYRKGRYSGSFEVTGKIISVFTGSSPLRHFKLQKK